MPEDNQAVAIQYIDFDIEIGKREGEQYPISAHSSLGGDANEEMVLPFSANERDRYLDKLKIALLSTEKNQRQLAPEERDVRLFGEKLFEAIFFESIRDCYKSSLALAQDKGKGLRLRLNIQADELSVLPWEFMSDPDEGDFLCLSALTPVVRYLECRQPIPPMEITPPLQVLGMVSNPVDQEALDVEAEKANLEKALAPLVERGLAKLTWLKDGSWRALLEAMSGGPWHIFHFIGHASYDESIEEGVLILEGEGKSTQTIRAGELARLLGQHLALRLAVLNACESAQSGEGSLFSSTAATLVRKRLPAVIAMQYKISDPAAIELSKTFYKGLADGLPVDAALSRARLALSLALKPTLEWGTPVLFMRTEDGILFKLKPSQKLADGDEKKVLPGERPGLLRRWIGSIDEHLPAGLRDVTWKSIGVILLAILLLVAFFYLSWEVFKPPITAIETTPINAHLTASALVTIFPGSDTKKPTPEPGITWTPTPTPTTTPTQMVTWADTLTPTPTVTNTVTPTPTPTITLTPTPTPGVGSTMISPHDGMTLVYVPAGSFPMGCDDCQKQEERPVHMVTLDAFWMDQTEVTNVMYAKFLTENGNQSEEGELWLDEEINHRHLIIDRGVWQAVENYADHPVIGVTWYGARDYCKWADRQLPSEAQWEYAARGTEGRTYPMGEVINCDVANYLNCEGKTTPVGSYPDGTSPFGVLDMAGNVFEWVADWYSWNYYQMSYEYDNPTGPDTGNYRVVRGGSWHTDVGDLRSSFRFIATMGEAWSSLGFRCVDTP